MDLDAVLEIKELSDADEVNEYLSREKENWSLIGVSSGQDSDLRPVFRYSLGRCFSFSNLTSDEG